MTLARRMALLWVIGGLQILLVGGGLALLRLEPVGLADPVRLAGFVASLCIAGALWLLAVAVVRRATLPSRAIWLVVGVAVAMRLLTLAAPPLLSSDVYRYVWDGRVQLAGINPYRHIPAAEALAPLRDEAVYPHINRADYAHTMYLPAAQALFAAAAVLTPGVFGMKLMIALFDAVAVAALILLLRMAGRDPAQVLIYAWMPLPVWEFVGNAHIDGVAASLFALALVAAARRRAVWTGVLLAGATLTKLLPIVVVPAFWRPWGWRLPLAFVATLVLVQWPYGWPVLGFFPGYAAEEGIGSGQGIFLLQLLGLIGPLPPWAVPLYFMLVLALLGALALRFAFATVLPTTPGARALVIAQQAAVLAAVLLVAVSPHYPWYLGILAPLACLAPLPSVLWLLAAAPLLAHGAHEYLAVPGLVFGPAIVLAAYDMYRRGPSAMMIRPQAVRSA